MRWEIAVSQGSDVCQPLFDFGVHQDVVQVRLRLLMPCACMKQDGPANLALGRLSDRGGPRRV